MVGSPPKKRQKVGEIVSQDSIKQNHIVNNCNIREDIIQVNIMVAYNRETFEQIKRQLWSNGIMGHNQTDRTMVLDIESSENISHVE